MTTNRRGMEQEVPMDTVIQIKAQSNGERTPLALDPLRLRVGSQGLRRQMYPPSQGDTAPQYGRYGARRGQRNLDAVFELLHTGTQFQ